MTKALLVNLFAFPLPSQVLALVTFLTGSHAGSLSLMAGEMSVFISQVITVGHQFRTGQLGQEVKTAEQRERVPRERGVWSGT